MNAIDHWVRGHELPFHDIGENPAEMFTSSRGVAAGRSSASERESAVCDTI
jgi:hypothetical protein